MKLNYLFIFAIILFSFHISLADCSINSNLHIGSRGIEVQCLQQKVGVTQDGSFGPMTRNAVMTFQSNHSLVADGFVGPLTRGALNNDVLSNIVPLSQLPQNNIPNTPINKVILPPKVLSVSPEKVRAGDIVTVKGENFSSTENTVFLRYGQIEDRFDNLSSNDGKTISFVFQPPNVPTASKEELLNLPTNTLNALLDPIKAAGGSIDDIVNPYRNMNNEDDLRQSLNNNGHSFDELYDKFYVTVENSGGQNTTIKPILSGLRKLTFGASLAETKKKDIFSKIITVFGDIFNIKKAYAQMPEGGTNSGIVMYCTCGDGYLTYMMDFSSNSGSGIYWWSSGFQPIVGTAMIAGPQLGFFIKNGGQCSIYAGVSCTSITANAPSLPWGEAP